MIKYSLICKNCNLSFDSWFASSFEFDKLKRKKILICPKCNSQNVEKNLMAPKLINKSKNENLIEKNLKFKKINKKIKEYQKFIKRNFDYVGENFAYEARSIHYNKNKSKKNIYGKASKEDVKELKEEGIDTTIIPWIGDKEN